MPAEGAAPLEKIVTLGQDQGCLRTDLPRDWMFATIFSLINTAADEIEAGRLPADTAPEPLTATLRTPASNT